MKLTLSHARGNVGPLRVGLQLLDRDVYPLRSTVGLDQPEPRVRLVFVTVGKLLLAVQS